jgi:hypothetical protein
MIAKKQVPKGWPVLLIAMPTQWNNIHRMKVAFCETAPGKKHKIWCWQRASSPVAQ